jgi:hypothetical protein
MIVRAGLAVGAALMATIAVTQAQTNEPSQMDRAQTTPQGTPNAAPSGRGGAVGTTGDATTGAGAVRREQQPKNTPIAPGSGGGRENQVPQMDKD